MNFRDLLTFRFIDRVTNTITFQSIYPQQLLKYVGKEKFTSSSFDTEENPEEEGDYENEFLVAEFLSFLKSTDLFEQVIEDHIQSSDDFFYKVMVGFHITPLDSQVDSGHFNQTHSYLVQIIRHSANSKYLFSSLNKQINSNLYFAYFSHQLRRILSSPA